MDEINAAHKERLQGTVAEGDTIRSFCKHPGFELYRKAIEDKLADKKNTWLRGSDEDARNARIRAQGIMEALDELKKFMLSGDQARKVLVQIAENSALEQPQAELKV